MADFLKTREQIDVLIEQTRLWIKKKSISNSVDCLESASQKLQILRSLAVSDIQNKIVFNRAIALDSLERQVDEILTKREADKK